VTETGKYSGKREGEERASPGPAFLLVERALVVAFGVRSPGARSAFQRRGTLNGIRPSDYWP